MKLALLLVLAVAAVVLGLSESRNVTRCELKTKLEAALKLPKKFTNVKQKYLALVICVLERHSLNTDLVRVSGDRVTTTAEPTTTTPTSAGETTTPKARLTPASPSRRRRQAEETTPEESEDQETTPEESEDQETPPEDEDEEEDSNFTAHDQDISDLLRALEDFVDEEKLNQDNYGTGADGSPWSLGRHGVYQLTDGHHCNSTYRSSSDVCNANCADFTDDDISDDSRCFAASYYHWWYAIRAGGRCIQAARSPRDYFKGCQ